MNQKKSHSLPFTSSAVAAAAALWLAGCGGGAGSADVPPAALTLDGVAATGAPLAGASVTVTDSAAATVCTTTSGSDGRYSCTLPLSAVAPFVVSAALDNHRLFSTAAGGGTANVTPLTTLIVARLAPGGDPTRLADAIHADPSLVTRTKLDAKVDELKVMLAPLLSAIGDVTDPLRGAFDANGRGHDKVLDTLQVNIRPEGSTSNIQITVKVLPTSNDSPPVEVSFKSNDTAPALPPVTIQPSDLPPDNVSALVEGFLARMTTCYALPLATRIAGVAPGAATATGGASSVQAAACRSLFVGDDPANYLDNGGRVASTAAFPGMFRERSTGTTFDRGTFEYRWANGNYFVSFRGRSTSGVISYSTLTLRTEGGVFKAAGNGYAYDASVGAYMVDREFPLQSSYSYLGSGYNVIMPNKVDAGGSMLFKEALVTRPDGRVLTYRPLAGRSLLGIVRDSGATSGSSVELAAAAYRADSTVGKPADKDGGFVFASRALSDDELRAIPDQGVWSIEWVHADAARSNVRQTYRTMSRALTIGELRQTTFANFAEPLVQEWLARGDVQAFGGISFGEPNALAPNALKVQASDGGDGWVLAGDSVALTSVTVFGSSASGSFNDTASITGSARKATVQCSKQSAADLHCDDTTGVLQYAAGSHIWTVEVFGRNVRQQEFAKHLALFRLAE